MTYPSVEVVGICRTANENVRDLQSNPNFRFVEADVTEPAGYDRELDGVSIVYGLAAQSAIYMASRDPVGDLRANVQGTLQLALSAAAAGVRKLVFTSGGAVYASQNRAREDQVGQPPLLPGRLCP
jgi:dTDP-glucose 4,6-dehydratase